MKKQVDKQRKSTAEKTSPKPLRTEEPLAEKDEEKLAEERTRKRTAEKDVKAELKIRGLK